MYTAVPELVCIANVKGNIQMKFVAAISHIRKSREGKRAHERTVS